MIAKIDNAALRLKVAGSLEFAPKISPDSRTQLVARLDTLIACLEVTYRQLTPTGDDNERKVNTRRKVSMCGVLTRIINICCLAPGISRSFDYDSWDERLGEFEIDLIAWYPDLTSRYSATNARL